jgi:hypothetical protein
MAKTIEFKVPFVAQQNTQTCWYVCAQMITRFWKGRVPGYSTGNAVDEAKTTTEINRLNMPVMGTPDVINMSVTPALGYTMWTPGGAPKGDDLYARLCQYGPLWYARNNAGFNDSVSGSHAVVITGVNVDGASSYVTIHDPWPPMSGQEDALYPYDEFFTKLKPLCVMYPPPERVLAPLMVAGVKKAWNYLLGRR